MRHSEYQCGPKCNFSMHLHTSEVSGRSSHTAFYKTIGQFLCTHLSLDPENMRDNAVQVRCQNQSPPAMDAFKGKEATVQEDPQELSARQHMAQKGAEEPDKQGQVIQDVSNVAPKTENSEDPLEQTQCSGVGNNSAAQGICML